MSPRLEYIFNLSKDDKELINDLEKAETDGRLNDTIRNYLRLGQTVAIAAIFSTNVDSLQTIYAPLDSRINDITTLVNRLLNGATGSSTKGNIGEKILISHLSSAFSYTKGDQFRAKSTEGHSGDIEATMMIERSPGIIEPVLAIIEAKFYDNPVPSSEVQKFWEDLSENKHNFGLFVSLNSPISNQQNCIHIESRGGKIGIFVYSENQDQMRHIVAYGMMREFARLNGSGQEITSAYSEVIVNLINQLSIDIEVFKESLGMLGEIERSATKILSDTSNQVTNIMSSTGRIRGSIQQGVARMEDDIRRASGELSIDAQELPKLEWNHDVWVPILERMPDKMAWILNLLRNTIIQMNDFTNMSILESADRPTIIFSKNGIDLVSMIALSNRLQICIQHDGESPEGFPKTKGGQIILTIDQKKSAVNDIDWPTLNDLLLSVVDGKEEE